MTGPGGSTVYSGGTGTPGDPMNFNMQVKPPDYSGIYDAAGKQYNVDPNLLRAMAQHESGEQTFDSQGRVLTSSAGAGGIMQFMPGTAKQYGVDVSDPVSSIYGGAHYMHDLLVANRGNVQAALTTYGGYNAPGSPGAIHYAQAVAGNYAKLQAPQPAQQPPQATQPQPPASQDSVGRSLFGTTPTQTPAAPAPAQAPQDGTALQTPSGTGSQLFGPQAPAAPPPEQQPAGFYPPGPGTGPVVAVPGRSAQPVVPAAAPQEGWWQRNVAGPVSRMIDPTQSMPPGQTQQPLLGMPILQDIGAGATQGMRNVAMNINRLSNWVDDRSPYLRALDERTAAMTQDIPGILGGISDPRTANLRLQAQTQAERQQYGDSLPATVAETAAPIVATGPLVSGATGLVRGAVAGSPAVQGAADVAQRVPFVGNLLTRAVPAAVEGAGVGAGSNLLTDQGDPGQAALTGAIGGAAIGGGAGTLGTLMGARGSAAADRLGFNLSLGEQGNRVAKNIEDITQDLPGSGAAAKTAEHSDRIAQILNRNIGLPENNGPVTTGTLEQAKANAGHLMDQSQNINIDAINDPTLLNQLSQIRRDAVASGINSVVAQVDRIENIILNHGGTLPGADLHNLISYRGALDGMGRYGDLGTKTGAADLTTALTDAAGRATQGNTAYDQFQLGRRQWKAIKTIEPSIIQQQGGSEDMSWPGLAARLTKNYATLPGDMQDLGWVLKGPLAALKSSGTGRQLQWQHLMPFGIGAGVGGGLGHLFVPGGMNEYLSVLGGAAATSAAGRMMRYPPSNQLMVRAGAPWVGNQLQGTAPP